MLRTIAVPPPLQYNKTKNVSFFAVKKDYNALTIFGFPLFSLFSKEKWLFSFLHKKNKQKHPSHDDSKQFFFVFANVTVGDCHAVSLNVARAKNHDRIVLCCLVFVCCLVVCLVCVWALPSVWAELSGAWAEWPCIVFCLGYFVVQHKKMQRKSPKKRGKERGKKREEAYSTTTSRVVPHRSTMMAAPSLTSRFGWDVVYSRSYGRRHLSLPATGLKMRICMA